MLLDLEAHFFQPISWMEINSKSQNPLWALSNDQDSSLALSYDRVKAMIWIFMPLQTAVQFFYKRNQLPL